MAMLVCSGPAKPSNSNELRGRTFEKARKEPQIAQRLVQRRLTGPLSLTQTKSPRQRSGAGQFLAKDEETEKPAEGPTTEGMFDERT